MMAEELLSQPGVYRGRRAVGRFPWLNTNEDDIRYIWQNEASRQQDECGSRAFGMLYINYLGTQINDGLKAVCTAGGTTVLDSFRNLHGSQDDDGVAAFKAVLQKHYPEGKSFTLLTNNRFPAVISLGICRDPRVSLGIRRRSVQRPKGLGAIVRVR